LFATERAGKSSKAVTCMNRHLRVVCSYCVGFSRLAMPMVMSRAADKNQVGFEKTSKVWPETDDDPHRNEGALTQAVSECRRD